MKEIYRSFFITINKKDGVYYVLRDGNYWYKFTASSDEEALEMYQAWRRL